MNTDLLKPNNDSSFALLTNLEDQLANVEIDDEEAEEIIRIMRRKMIISKARKLHQNKISKRGDGRFYTNVNGKKVIGNSGESEEEFLIRLYNDYYSDAPKAICLDDIFGEFLEFYKLGRADDTWRDCEVYYNNHIKGSKLATMDISKIQYADVANFFDDLSVSHVGQHPTKFYEKIRTILNQMFRYGARMRYLNQIPSSYHFDDISMRFMQREMPVTWSREEYKKMLANFNDEDVYDRALHFQTIVGSRTSELISSKFEDVIKDQKDRPVLHIHTHYQRRLIQDPETGKYHQYYEVVDCTKGRRRYGIHDVPLSDRALALIQISREQNPDGVFIFEKDGKPLSPRTYNDHVKAFCRSIGVKELSNYASRRLFVSELETSKNHQELMKVMGWSTDNTRHYATSLDDDLYDAVTRLGNTETQ